MGSSGTAIPQSVPECTVRAGDIFTNLASSRLRIYAQNTTDSPASGKGHTGETLAYEQPLVKCFYMRLRNWFIVFEIFLLLLTVNHLYLLSEKKQTFDLCLITCARRDFISVLRLKGRRGEEGFDGYTCQRVPSSHQGH